MRWSPTLRSSISAMSWAACPRRRIVKVPCASPWSSSVRRSSISSRASSPLASGNGEMVPSSRSACRPRSSGEMCPAGSGGPETSASIAMSSLGPVPPSASRARSRAVHEAAEVRRKVGRGAEGLALRDRDLAGDAELPQRAHDEPRPASLVVAEDSARGRRLRAGRVAVEEVGQVARVPSFTARPVARTTASTFARSVSACARSATSRAQARTAGSRSARAATASESPRPISLQRAVERLTATSGPSSASRPRPAAPGDRPKTSAASSRRPTPRCAAPEDGVRPQRVLQAGGEVNLDGGVVHGGPRRSRSGCRCRSRPSRAGRTTPRRWPRPRRRPRAARDRRGPATRPGSGPARRSRRRA